MIETNARRILTFAALAAFAVFAAGCGGTDDASTTTGSADSDAPAAKVADTDGGHADEHEHEHTGHNLHGWWCSEHGVPEEECGQCNARLAADFKAKGDWCDEHNRPKSQCFVCEPALFDQFAARYEAKFGEKPPRPEE